PASTATMPASEPASMSVVPPPSSPQAGARRSTARVSSANAQPVNRWLKDKALARSYGFPGGPRWADGALYLETGWAEIPPVGWRTPRGLVTTSAVDPIVSVLLPFRDAAPTLAEALDSVLAQEGPRLEVLAVDDGSTDSGREIVESRAARDPRVVPLRTVEARRGIVAALSLAASRARGALLGRMDADDVCLPGRLARQVELL